jgi:hypothetical protein
VQGCYIVDVPVGPAVELAHYHPRIASWSDLCNSVRPGCNATVISVSRDLGSGGIRLPDRRVDETSLHLTRPTGHSWRDHGRSLLGPPVPVRHEGETVELRVPPFVPNLVNSGGR